ncbi:carbon-nitrogen hydrolase family protein [Paenibacillus sp. 7124]|uniref:Carbon-nitrogen hydrolase family protein n=1 Tax=Paenibacillus apii TaxID=1850370 RepID=A0A6M1PJT4_9BACL|nr:carbon-nitrogen hydrolase family protein [Paenibacillus apii]NGM82814.1 carbon-nitrogen hydrolase family protein [Paenibacillus apii]NJJ39954.1 carbon-nitrogen hydrolase family protein [Paenibacillus apii]
MRLLNVGLVQMDSVIKDIESNILKSERYIDRIGQETDIICFPELFTTGYNFDLIQDEFYSLAETIPGPTVERLAAKAKHYGTAIIGNIVERDELQSGVLYDTAFVINEKGEYIGKYRKVHLYPSEHQYFRNGVDFPVFELFGTKVGVVICYDHAFEEAFRILALKGAEIIFIPSVIPKNYEYLLDLRTSARAQDNQIFTVAVNRVGMENRIVYCGKSKIVNPRGEVVVEAGDQEEVLIGQIDTSLILKERKQEPVFRDRRPELYSELTK